MHSVFAILAAALVAPALAAPAPQASAASGASAGAPVASPSAELIQQVLNAPSQLQRQRILGPDAFKFSFTNPPAAPPAPAGAPAPGAGGKIVTANRLNFPALIGNGISMAVATLNPCGFNLPHIHPRGTEILVVIKGRVKAAMILENGAEPINTDLKEMEMTVFPEGSLHLNFNPTCEPVTFFAGFNSEDAGVDTVTTNLFRFKNEEIAVAFGEAIDGAKIDEFRKNLPVNVAQDVDVCLKKCGMKKEDYKKPAQNDDDEKDEEDYKH